MPFIESMRGLWLALLARPAAWAPALLLAAAAGMLAGCSSSRGGAAGPPTSAPGPSPGITAASLPPAGRVGDWGAYQRQAAQRLVAASPGQTYMGVPPEPLLAIPVLEVELNANGSVRRVNVMREPTQALDTTQLAIDAVYRAAPFGEVSHLPRPWRFTEVFLFDDNRRFKPRSLD